MSERHKTECLAVAGRLKRCFWISSLEESGLYSRRTGRLAMAVMACAFTLLSPLFTSAQQYYWKNFVGVPGMAGSSDGGESGALFNLPCGVAVDSNGNMYVPDYNNDTIRKITPAGVVTTLAGSPGVAGSSDGTGSAARFNNPLGVAVDGNGNVYVADKKNDTIRKVTPDGVVTTLAGSPRIAGSNDGTGSAARFNAPQGVAVDGNGNVFVADYNNDTIRKVTPAGVVTTLAGSPGVAGSTDGTGSEALFNLPASVAVDGNGNVYVADFYNEAIRKVSSTGMVTTLAGNPGVAGSCDGTGSAALFNHPAGVALEGNGNLYVSDWKNDTIRKVTPAGVVTTVAGSPGAVGSRDGTGSMARFYQPQQGGVDTNGNFYVADTYNDTIRRVTPAGVVTTVAGTPGVAGSSGGAESVALFSWPSGTAVDSNGNIYVPDYNNDTIRKVTPAGVVTTLAGSPGVAGSSDGTGSAALFNGPCGVAVDGSGNVYVGDYNNDTIRKVTPGGVVTTLAGSPGIAGSSNGTGSAALFFKPQGLTVDGNGNVYVAEFGNDTIRKVTSAGVVTTLAGSPGIAGSSDGTGSAASFYRPSEVAVDGNGNLYVADWGNDTIRKVTSAGVVTTLAGSPGIAGSSDGTGSAALFNGPNGVAADGNGNVYVADWGNDTVRKVTSSGVVTTLAGSPGVLGSSDGTGSAALFFHPQGGAVDGDGNFYVGDQWNETIRKVTPAGVVTTLAGTPGVAGSRDGVGSAALFYRPVERTLVTATPAVSTGASTGTVYNATTLNGTVNPDGSATTVWFAYGATKADGTVTTPQSAGSGMSAAPFSAAITGLKPSTTYHYQIVATNSSGTTYGLVQTFTTLTPTPAVTTGNATGTGYNRTMLNGTVDPHGLATTAYFQYGTSAAYGSTTLTQAAGQGTSSGPVSIRITGLNGATTYHYRIAAINSSGTSYGLDRTFMTANPPPAVTTGAATGIEFDGATLQGTVNPNGLATTVIFEYGSTASYGQTTELQLASSGAGPGVFYTQIAGLAASSVYHYRIVAANSSGTSQGIGQTFTTANPPPTVTTGVATGVTSNGGTLNGSVNPNGYAASIYFRYGTSTSYGSTTTEQAAGNGANAISFSAKLTGLNRATTYHFCIVATGASGTSTGDDQTFTTSGPP